MSNLPILYSQHRAYLRALDWRFVDQLKQMMRMRDIRYERVQAGITTMEEEFGKSMTGQEMRDAFDRKYPGGPRTYRLPPCLHWMGDGKTNQSPWVAHDEKEWKARVAQRQRRNS